MDLSNGLVLANGSVAPWSSIQAGRHFLVSPVPTDKWNVVLGRVSSDAQRDGRSLPQQVEDGFRYSARRGELLSVAYLDPGLSATRLSFAQRPGVRQLIDDIRAGRVCKVYVYKRDRVSRQEHEWIQFLKTCTQHKAEIEFTAPDEPPIGKGAYAQFTEHIIIAAAALESNLIRMRVLDNIRARARNGEWIGGSLPSGLRKTADGSIEEDPLPASVIKEIFRLAHDEILGGSRIADAINVTFPGSRFGKPWTKRAIEKVLQSRVYSGVLSFSLTNEDGDREQIEVASPHFPILVTNEMWQKVAAMRAGRVRSKGTDPSRNLSSQNLLMGILRCGVCGRPMVGRHNVRRYERQDGAISEYHAWYYRCRYGPERDGCTYTSNVRQYLVDDVVVGVVNSVVSNLAVEELEEKIREYQQFHLHNILDQIKAAQLSLSQIDTAISRNHSCLETCKPDLVPLYEQRVAELVEQRASQLASLSELEMRRESVSQSSTSAEKVLEAVRDWPQRYVAASPNQRRALVSDVVEKVVWHPTSRKLDVVLRVDPRGPLFGDDFVGQDAGPGFPAGAFCITTETPPLGEIRSSAGKRGRLVSGRGSPFSKREEFCYPFPDSAST